MKTRTLLFLYALSLALTYLALQAGNYFFALGRSDLWYSPAHVLGGVAIGAFALLLSRLAGLSAHYGFSLVLVLIIGGAWELWEYLLQLIEFPADIRESIADIILDATGASVAFLYLRKYL